MICVYSLRARERPFVSFPLAWRELENFVAVGRENVAPPALGLQVIHSEAVTRAEKQGDLFQEVLVKKQKLPHL
jgi:bifunctional non-homologous end joining protein LigD